MRLLQLLQLGDIHYPQLRGKSAVVDQKDKAMDEKFVATVSADKLQSVARAICSALGQHHIAGILICGDLTSWGDIPGYKECLNYLATFLNLGHADGPANADVHVVPGNHDVDRSVCTPENQDFYKKFEAIEKLWIDLQRPILTVRDVRSTTIANSNGRAQIYSLNSCIGCGEKRSLPVNVQNDLYSILEAYSSRTTLEEAFGVVGEQLDTPAFVENHISSLVEELRQLDDFIIPIVLAHHNILPQAMPQVTVYTEVINAGLVRTRLLELQQPVIYCHGHIHCDPIEILNLPSAAAGPVVSVSAPLLENGFNVLEIAFGQKNIPLGCRVIPYRARNDGSVVSRTAEIVRIPLRRADEYVKVGHDRLGDMLQYVSAASHERFSTVLDRARSQSGTSLHEATVAETLREAEWLGLVSILNGEDKPKHWHIMKSVP